MRRPYTTCADGADLPIPEGEGRLHGGVRGHDPEHVDALASLNLHYPKVSSDKLNQLAAAKRALIEER
jgi:hypothetical protein